MLAARKTVKPRLHHSRRRYGQRWDAEITATGKATTNCRSTEKKTDARPISGSRMALSAGKHAQLGACSGRRHEGPTGIPRRLWSTADFLSASRAPARPARTARGTRAGRYGSFALAVRENSFSSSFHFLDQAAPEGRERVEGEGRGCRGRRDGIPPPPPHPRNPAQPLEPPGHPFF